MKVQALSSSRTLLLSFALLLNFAFAGCGAGTTGHNSGAPTWDYTALGDSLAAGLIAEEGYVGRYASYVNIDTGANVDTTNLGVPGWTSGDLLNSLQTDPIFRNQITGALVVTWDIGGNDLNNAHSAYTQRNCGGTDDQDCLRNTVATFEQNWSAIITQLTALRSTSNTIIRTMDIYNPYVASDMQVGIFDITEPYLDEVNNYIHSTATAAGIPVANVHQAFNGADGTTDPGTLGLLAADGFHPNDAGHKVIADQLRALGYAPLH
ncbi:MAG TPA: GDSL-type esterase/lipase family protein [Candidatus Bathyarchaeia archaeon]|nr:GDSL-type esterase/lipase family protein [Candidatus Bathyarchaeia archaeon]